VIKPETQMAIKALPLENRQNLLRFIYTTMKADQFAAAFLDGEGDQTEEHKEISVAFAGDADDDDEPDNSEFELAAERLHEAICEGPRQDAIDILNEVTDLNFRSVAAQMNLFPDRITL
jgi:hypothetical protein